MINFKEVLRFLTKDSVDITIEEFLFLWVVRAHKEEKQVDKKEIMGQINLYYQKNIFYGKKEYASVEQNATGWNLMIDKLVKQGYLLDYRDNKKLIEPSKLIVTELFSDKIWFNKKEETWERLFEFINEKCGLFLQIEGVDKISFFYVNQRDPIINSFEGLKDYFWKKICKEGDNYCTEKFFADFESYLSFRNLDMKLSNFLINYHAGTLEKEIQIMVKKSEERGSSSSFTRL